ncbi:MAG: DUF6398 domain-containing protein [Nostocoides sp.]
MAHRNDRRRRPARLATRKPSVLNRRVHEQADPRFQPLILGLRSALRDDAPWALPSAVSAILQAVESSDLPGLRVEALVESFLEVDIAETTAALHVMVDLLDDEPLRNRIADTLTGRKQPMPDSVTGFAALTVPAAYVVDGGGAEQIILELSAPGVPAAHLHVYVDHVAGTAVRDGYLVPEDTDAMIETLREASRAAGVSIRPEALLRADARARIEMALRVDVESLDQEGAVTWPGLRPFLVSVLTRMPLGGTAYDPVETAARMLGGVPFDAEFDDDPSLDEETELAHDFLDGTDPATLSGNESVDHTLAHLIAGVGVRLFGEGGEEWTPETVRIAMTGVLPVLVIGDREAEAALPQVLHAFVRWLHADLDVDAATTGETILAIDRHEAEYHRRLADPELRAEAESLRDRMQAEADRWGPRAQLVRAVGEESVDTLDAEPLPDEAFDWSAIAPDISGKVAMVASLLDQFCLQYYDAEVRTACRRLLARVAAADPKIFRRAGRTETAAAAVAWIITKASDLAGFHDSPLSMGELAEWFGVKGSPSSRAQAFLKAIGVDPYRLYAGMELGTPDLLTSRKRQWLLRLRG